MTLEGESEDNVILDAEEVQGVIKIENSPRVTIADLTLQGGYQNYGGGINCYNSNPLLRNLTIKENRADYYGGGIYLSYSSPYLENITITGNQAEYGGGICFSSSISCF